MNVLDIIKTVGFNFRVLEFRQALHLPILISRDINTSKVRRNSIIIKAEELKCGMIRIGLNVGSDGIIAKGGYLETADGATITFCGAVRIARGSTIKAINGGQIIIGNNFSANCSLEIFCKKEVSIGNDVLMGWRITIDDGDGHPIYNSNGERINENKSIVIKDHVWVAAEVKILKGAEIPFGSVVGYGSIVNKKYKVQNSIYAGRPAEVVKKDVYWEK